MLKINKGALKTIVLMMIFTLVGTTFLIFVGQYALLGQHPFQFFADSNTYHQTYAGEASNFDGTLIGVSNNYLGPILILRLLQGNIYLVLILNVYIFTHSIIYLSKLLAINPLKVIGLLLISPLTISCLLSVNKEIFLFPFLAFAVKSSMHRTFYSVVIALLLSILVRWQITFFYLLALLVRLPLIRRRFIFLGLLLLSISIAYVLVQPWIQPILAAVALSIENYDEGGIGLFELTSKYQSNGFYFLIFPIKALHLLFGMGLKFEKLLNPIVIYNDLFVGGHCAAALFMFIALLKNRLFTIHSDLIYASIIFLAVFCVTPVFAPRYLYFVYVLWALVLAGAPKKITPPLKANSHRLWHRKQILKLHL